MAPRYRMGSLGGGNLQAAPTAPSNGSGGPGILGMGATVNVSPAVSEVSDVMTGRVTLGLINLTILAMIGFYVWTRSAQGGG
jgi:hypothetical protein